MESDKLSNSETSNIYQLSEFQYANLERASTYLNCVIFTVSGPQDGDTTEAYNGAVKDMREMDDLIRMGLLQDMTEKVKEKHTLAPQARAFGITTQGILLFNKTQKLKEI